MRKSLCFTIAVVFSSLSFTQNLASFEKKSEFKPPYFLSRYIGSTGTNHYFVCWDQKSGKKESQIMVCKYDHNLSRSQNAEYASDKLDDNKTFMADITLLGGKLYLFRYTASKRIATLYIQEIDPNTLSLIGTPKMISDRKYEDDNDLIGRSFQIGYNSDSSKVVISSTNWLTSPGDKLWLSVHVMDLDLNTLWKKEMSFKEKTEETWDFSTHIGPNGDLYGNFFIRDGGMMSRKKTPYLFSATNGGTAFSVNEISLSPFKAVTNMAFFRKGNKTLAFGLYSDLDYRYAKGYFLADIEKSGLVIKTNKDFTPDMIRNFNGNSVYDDKENELFTPRDLYAQSVPGGTLIGIFQTSTRPVATRGGGYMTQYPSGNFIIIRLDDKNEEKWHQVVARNVNSFSNSNTSYVVSHNPANDKTHILFADFAENTGNDTQNAKMLVFGSLIEGGNLKQHNVAVVSIDKNGVMLKEHQMPYKDHKIEFLQFEFYPITGGRGWIWMPSLDGVFQLYTMSLK